jgi:hypothetical protein
VPLVGQRIDSCGPYHFSLASRSFDYQANEPKAIGFSFDYLGRSQWNGCGPFLLMKMVPIDDAQANCHTGKLHFSVEHCLVPPVQAGTENYLPKAGTRYWQYTKRMF